jgi:predicted adenine nucleotide alpha hydrolase (AANH) superfamily ATPase
MFEKLQKEALEAALYKLKYCGCSISFEEITEYLSLVK